MINKNLAIILSIIFLVSFVVAETTTPSTTPAPQQQGVTQTVNSETGVTTLSQNGQEFMSIPRGFEVSEASPSVYTWEGKEGTLTGKAYTLKNTGQGAKQGDSTAVKFGNSEVDVPLFSQATLYQDKDGNSYIYNSGAGNPISLTTPSGTFEKVEGARFKLDENGEVLKADYGCNGQSSFSHKFNLNGNEVSFMGSRIGESSQISFDSETGKVFAHMGHGENLGSLQANLGEGKVVVLQQGSEKGEFPSDFSATFLSNGQDLDQLNIRGGYYQKNIGDKHISFSSDDSKNGFTLTDMNFAPLKSDQKSNTAYILGDAGYVNGPLEMNVFTSGGEEFKTPLGYTYKGTSSDSRLEFRTGEQGQNILIANQDFVVGQGGTLLTSQGDNIKWNTGGEVTTPMDIYYGGSSPDLQTADIGGMKIIRTSTNPTKPTLQTENVQIASTSSTTAQNQQQQVAQNSIWQRLFR